LAYDGNSSPWRFGRRGFRWEAGPLEVVKPAAANIGVPYQTYIKQVIFQRALEDIARYQAVAGDRAT
jgi:hypothetical protein